MTLPPSPADRGFRMPAEWEPHAATWLSWPHNRDTWPDDFEAVEQSWATLARTIAAAEPVRIVAAAALHARISRILPGASNISLVNVATDDAWIRDYGPTFLVDDSCHQIAAVDWRFDAWGKKYSPCDADDAVVTRLTKALGCERFPSEWVIEGGALEVNGQGTLIATRDCLLDPRRNPNVSPSRLEKHLARYLAIRNIVWLSGALAGDDTDGHVDQVARFVNPTTIVCAAETNRRDANYEALSRNRRVLESARDQKGKRFRIVPLPMPKPVFHGSVRLPASYANFYIANGLVVVPAFDDPMDLVARQILDEQFPDRRAVSVPSRLIVRGLGAVHCITSQQPMVRPA